jgi:amino acid transporter
MLELAIALFIFGLSGLILGAMENYNGANALAWIVAILLIIFVVLRKFKKPTIPHSNGY